MYFFTMIFLGFERGEGKLKKRFFFLVVFALFLVIISACSSNTTSSKGGKDWRPDKTIEIVAPSGAGGGWDTTARMAAKVLGEEKIIDQKMGGGK
jgi:putative tricarboxylic transport membrane protein